MNWTEVKITTTSAGIDHVCAALLALGIEGSVIEDPQDLFEFLKGAQAHWDYVDESLLNLQDAPVTVKIYLPQTPHGAETLVLVRESLDRLKTFLPPTIIGTLDVDLAVRTEEDWANNWKQYYNNIFIEDKLVISPLWQESPVCGPGMAVVKMDPGMAFGTGAHETTRLCLKLLCHQITGAEEILDLGCGSGILGISALKLGAKTVRAIDIDPLATQIAMENAALNGLGSPEFLSSCENVLSGDNRSTSLLEGQYDLILANIVADVILPLFSLVKPALKTNGQYLVSGIIGARTQEVERTAEEHGFTLKERLCENDWYAYIFTI
jgi:ribosomal protein L11 methyltransferase